MANIWYPIESALTTDGAFSALSGFDRADELKPIPLAAADKNYDKADFLIDSRFIYNSLEAEIAYGKFFEGKLNNENRLFMYEFSIYKAATTTVPQGGLITGTRHGAAVRIGIFLKNLKLNLSANIIAISAAVALNQAEATYRIEGIAFGNALSIVAAELPIAGTFDYQAFSKIVGLGQKLVDWTQKNVSMLGMVPIQVEITKTWDDAMADASQSVYYAIKKIRDGTKLEAALGSSKPLNIQDDVVRDTYLRITGSRDPNYVPRGPDKDIAAKWLEFK